MYAVICKLQEFSEDGVRKWKAISHDFKDMTFDLEIEDG
jgi:hypothetical protein